MGYASSQMPHEAAGTTTPISSRVFLRAGKKYRASVKIVSKVTKARTFEIEIDASDESQPVRSRA
jgi:hypothetical protein